MNDVQGSSCNYMQRNLHSGDTTYLPQVRSSLNLLSWPIQLRHLCVEHRRNKAPEAPDASVLQNASWRAGNSGGLWTFNFSCIQEIMEYWNIHFWSASCTLFYSLLGYKLRGIWMLSSILKGSLLRCFTGRRVTMCGMIDHSVTFAHKAWRLESLLIEFQASAPCWDVEYVSDSLPLHQGFTSSSQTTSN